MPKGYVITVGASLVSGAPFGRPDLTYSLPSAETDAFAVRDRALAEGLTIHACLTGGDATTAAFSSAVASVATAASSEDLVILHFSGHGTILYAPNLHEDPSSPSWGDLNAAICFFDRPFLDDELLLLYAKFKTGTRVLVLLDSCYSGGMTDGLESPALGTQADPVLAAALPPPPPSPSPVPHALPHIPPRPSQPDVPRMRRLPTAIERAFLDWLGRGKDSEQVALGAAKFFGKLLPFHHAELSFIANLPAYRQALPDRLWPRTFAEFNSDRFVSPATRHRIQLLPKKQREAVLMSAFAEGRIAADHPTALRRWELEGPHRNVVIDVPDGALLRWVEGFRNAAPRALLRSARPPVGPSVQMLCATVDGFAKSNVFTPQFLQLEPGYAKSHVSFAKELDSRIHTIVGPWGQSVTRAYSAPEPVTFTLQHPWQVS